MQATVQLRIDTGHSDGMPHAFIRITQADGRCLEYGLAPVNAASILGPGKVACSGDGMAQGRRQASIGGPVFNLSDDQHRRLMKTIARAAANPPAYRFWEKIADEHHSRNCVEWTADIWRDAALPHAFGFTQHWSPYSVAADRALLEARNTLADTLLTRFTQAEIAMSPLVLDLDGNGVRTTRLQAGTYFDHDGNGFAERTGWLAPGDALLVLDRNGDGAITDGGELFGNHTHLDNGQLAANGFDALAELDDNLDGRVDAQDAAFARLRLWRDDDGDGQVAPAEWLTLTQAGVRSLGTAYTSSDRVDANGNAHRQLGDFTRDDSGIGAVHDVWFETDTVRTRELRKLPLRASVAALPDLACMSDVPSLRQAMQRDASGELESLVRALANGGARDAAWRDDMVTQIIYRWTGVSGPTATAKPPSGPLGYLDDARKLHALERLLDRTFRAGPGAEELASLPRHGNEKLGPDATRAINAAFNELMAYVSTQLRLQSDTTPFHDAVRFTFGQDRIDIDTRDVGDKLQARYAQSPSQAASAWARYAEDQRYHGMFGQHVLASIQRQGETRTDNAGALLRDGRMGTQRSDVLHADAARGTLLFGLEGNDTLRGGRGDDLLSGGKGNDVLRGGPGNDVYVFGQGDGIDTIFNQDDSAGRQDVIRFTDVPSTGLHGLRQMGRHLQIDYGEDDRVTIKHHFSTAKHRIDRFEFSDGVAWSTKRLLRAYAPAKMTNSGKPGSGTSALFGTPGDDDLHGGAIDDRIDGGRGHDIITGGAGNDRLYGASGRDSLDGEEGDDLLNGGHGDDTLYGGRGNDTLKGGPGHDIYAFRTGDGSDTIINDGGGQDTIRFADVTLDNLRAIRRENNDLLLDYGFTDSIRVTDHFAGDHRQIDEIKFAGHTSANAFDIHAAWQATTARMITRPDMPQMPSWDLTAALRERMASLSGVSAINGVPLASPGTAL